MTNPARFPRSSGHVFLLGVWAWGAAGCGASHGDQPAAAATSTGAIACVVDSSAQPTCPSPEPSYAGTVKNIISTNCQTCHASGGIGAATTGGPGRTADSQDPNGNVDTQAAGGGAPNDANQPRPPHFDSDTAHDWSVLENIRRSSTKMMQMLFLCTMPPADASSLSAEDRTTLAGWLKCGAKDN